METAIEALSVHPIFSMLSEKEQSYLMQDSKIVEYKKNEMMCKQGAESEYAFLLIDGFAKLYIEYHEDGELLLTLGTPKTFVGLFFMLGSETYPYSLKTLTKTAKCCLIRRDHFTEIAKNNIDFLFNFSQTMGQNSYNMAAKLLVLDRKNVRGRIADILLHVADVIFHSDSFTLPLSRKDLSNIVNISTENTVRILSEFDKDKIISVNNKQIRILNKPMLQMISEKG